MTNCTLIKNRDLESIKNDYESKLSEKDEIIYGLEKENEKLKLNTNPMKLRIDFHRTELAYKSFCNHDIPYLYEIGKISSETMDIHDGIYKQVRTIGQSLIYKINEEYNQNLNKLNKQIIDEIFSLNIKFAESETELVHKIKKMNWLERRRFFSNYKK